MNNLLVLDVGGTWLRTGIFSNGALIADNKKLISLIRETSDFFSDFIRSIIETIYDYKKLSHFDEVVISLGACLNHHTGEIYYSAPLFGETRLNVDFREILTKKITFPLKISIINDVSALCYAYDYFDHAKNLTHVAVLTISSGIAMRRFDVKSKKVIVDQPLGLQGEVGHLPVYNPFFSPYNKQIFCECGGANHTAAYSSGKGLDHIITNYLDASVNSCELIKELFLKHKIGALALKEALQANSPDAEMLLNIVAYPIAYIIVLIFCISPEIDRLFISGGMVETLGSLLEQRIFKLISEIAYVYDEPFYRRRVLFFENSSTFGLIGAGHYSTLRKG